MGLTAVCLLSSANNEKNTQEVSSEKEVSLNVEGQQLLPEEFQTIVREIKQLRRDRIVPVFTYRPSPLGQRMLRSTGEQVQDWQNLFLSKGLLSLILQFLNVEDLSILRNCNRCLKRMCTTRILRNDNNWNLTMNLLAPYLMKETQLRESGIEEEYEHSEDLDRTSGYFESEDQSCLNQQKLKLDKIITTLSFKVRYFQGIMPICAVLLQCFNENISYWILRYMLVKCQYIQNDINFYSRYLKQLEQEFKILLPEVYKHLEFMGFQLNYFVMKWVMGLFSEDMGKSMLLALWDLLCQSDVYILIYVIIQIFKLLQDQLLKSDADEINQILKAGLKQKLSEINCEQFMHDCKQMYVGRRLQIW